MAAPGRADHLTSVRENSRKTSTSREGGRVTFRDASSCFFCLPGIHRPNLRECNAAGFGAKTEAQRAGPVELIVLRFDASIDGDLFSSSALSACILHQLSFQAFAFSFPSFGQGNSQRQGPDLATALGFFGLLGFTIEPPASSEWRLLSTHSAPNP